MGRKTNDFWPGKKSFYYLATNHMNTTELKRRAFYCNWKMLTKNQALEISTATGTWANHWYKRLLCNQNFSPVLTRITREKLEWVRTWLIELAAADEICDKLYLYIWKKMKQIFLFFICLINLRILTELQEQRKSSKMSREKHMYRTQDEHVKTSLIHTSLYLITHFWNRLQLPRWYLPSLVQIRTLK